MGEDQTGTEGFYCHSCGKFHAGLPMDLGFNYPAGWEANEEPGPPNMDFYTIEDSFFIRGCLEIPVLDGPGPFVWGVWTTLSEKNWNRAREIHNDDQSREQEPPYFGWFANRLPGYPETLLLKTMVHLRAGGLRPWVELEPTDHPLAVEQREGITMARVHEILKEAGFAVEAL